MLANATPRNDCKSHGHAKVNDLFVCCLLSLSKFLASEKATFSGNFHDSLLNLTVVSEVTVQKIRYKGFSKSKLHPIE